MADIKIYSVETSNIRRTHFVNQLQLGVGYREKFQGVHLDV